MTPVSISFKIEKATPEGRYVSGWLSVVQKDGKVVEDTQGDRISMSELRKGVHKYMAGSRVIKKQHAGDQIGEMREIVIIDDDFAKAHGITHTKRGAWGTAEITDAATREDVKKGKVTGWSMGGKGKRVPIVKAGRTLGSRVAAFRARGVERSMNRAELAANSREVRGLGAGKERAKFSRLGRKFDGLRARARVTKSAGYFDRFL